MVMPLELQYAGRTATRRTQKSMKHGSICNLLTVSNTKGGDTRAFSEMPLPTNYAMRPWEHRDEKLQQHDKLLLWLPQSNVPRESAADESHWTNAARRM
jgi:hypothetical protein